MKTLSKKRYSIKLEQICFFDCETQGLDATKFLFVNFLYKQKNYIFKDIEQAKLFILTCKAKYFVAHNIEFDLLCLFGNYYKIFERVIYQNKFLIGYYQDKIFFDSLNIFKTSLKEIGKKIGIEKMNISQDLTLGTGKYTEKDIEYCKRDCLILYKAFELLDEIVCIGFTIGSIALTQYKTKFYKEKIEYTDLVYNFLKSYRGGRVEVFKFSTNEKNVYDINSLYPFVMRNLIFPDTKELVYEENPINWNEKIQNFEGCGKFLINVPFMEIPILPLIKDGKLIFPYGLIKGTFNFNEIRYAITKGYDVLDCYNITYSKGIKSPFVSFVDYFYNKKQHETNQAFLFIWKYILNNLYGKFAQGKPFDLFYFESLNLKEYTIFLEKNPFHEIVNFSEVRNDFFAKIVKDEFPNHSIPSFASYITSEARIELHKAMLKIPFKNLHYCDTDSIFIDSRLNTDLNISNKLGDWKREKYTVLNIYGLKSYKQKKLNGMTVKKIKGIKKDAKETAPNLFEFNTIVKARGALARNLIAGAPLKVKKRIKTNFTDKRIILKNNVDTKPLYLNMF